MNSKCRFPEFYFESSGGEGPLYVYFEDGPYGNAVDDETGSGAGFFNDQGRLIAVLFDHVAASSDRKMLKFAKKQFVEVVIKNGKAVELKSSHTKISKRKASPEKSI